jgi:hypothetical protein
MQTNFSTMIRPARQAQLCRRFAAGLPVFRGKQDGRAPSDPGDFGQGTYYSTSKARAANYGALKPFTIVLTKPLLLTVEEAYTQIADRYGTISGVAGHPETGAGDFVPRAARAAEATSAVRSLGHDGLAAINSETREIEIVVFPSA